MTKRTSDVLKTLRKRAGFSQKEVYEKFNIPQSTFSSWETGKADPPAEMLMRLCNLYGVTDVLLEFGYDHNPGDGTVQPTCNELYLIEKYRQLDDFGRKAVNAIMDIEMERQEEKLPDVVSEEPLIYLPYPILPASAGTGMYLDSGDGDMIEVPNNELTRQATMVLRVRGDSMEPDYKDNDKVLVQTMPEVEIGEIGAFIINSEGFIKEMGEGRLKSKNPAYKDIIIREGDDIKCVGKVIGKL